jgi:hypothetical protein
MKASTKRLILRVSHLIVVIPVLGYIYQPVAEAEQYQRFTQTVFIPLAILTGYWMYGGFVFAVIGAASWITASYLSGFSVSGFGAALLCQIVLFIILKVYLMTRKRNPPVAEARTE